MLDNHSHSLSSKSIDHLYFILSKIKSESDMALLLQDLCTPQEIESMAQRLEVVKLLKQGYAYRNIHENCGASLATITRIARTLKYGVGGYQIIESIKE